MKLPKEVIAYITATQQLITEIEELLDLELFEPYNTLISKINKCDILYEKMMKKQMEENKS
jgi:hypothetical protein